MSEAELFTAFHAALGAAHSVLFGYISLMSGFLIMSYFAADKLSTVLAAIVITLFSAASCLMTFRIYLNRNDARAIASYMFEQKQSGSLELSWFGSNPPWTVGASSFLEVAVVLGGFLGCLVFFFYQRQSPNR